MAWGLRRLVAPHLCWFCLFCSLPWTEALTLSLLCEFLRALLLLQLCLLSIRSKARVHAQQALHMGPAGTRAALALLSLVPHAHRRYAHRHASPHALRCAVPFVLALTCSGTLFTVVAPPCCFSKPTRSLGHGNACGTWPLMALCMCGDKAQSSTWPSTCTPRRPLRMQSCRVPPDVLPMIRTAEGMMQGQLHHCYRV